MLKFYTDTGFYKCSFINCKTIVANLTAFKLILINDFTLIKDY